MSSFVTYKRTGKTYEFVAAGADMHGCVPPQNGRAGQWTVVRDLTPHREYHTFESDEVTPVVLRAFIATNHMTVTEFHGAEYRPDTASGNWTPNGYENWVKVTVDNNGGDPVTTWVLASSSYLVAVPQSAA